MAAFSNRHSCPCRQLALALEMSVTKANSALISITRLKGALFRINGASSSSSRESLIGQVAVILIPLRVSPNTRFQASDTKFLAHPGQIRRHWPWRSSNALSCWRALSCAASACSRARDKSRIASSRSSGTTTATSSPARDKRESIRQSRRSVFTLSAGRRGIFAGATTSHA